MNGEYECPFCGKKFSKPAELAKHLIYDDCQRKSGKKKKSGKKS